MKEREGDPAGNVAGGVRRERRVGEKVAFEQESSGQPGVVTTSV